MAARYWELRIWQAGTHYKSGCTVDFATKKAARRAYNLAVSRSYHAEISRRHLWETMPLMEGIFDEVNRRAMEDQS